MNEPIEQREAFWSKSILPWVLDQLQPLTQLREILPTRLISGQLRLPEAEILLENSL